MIIKFTKLHKDAKTPQKAHLHDAGFDLSAVSWEFIKSAQVVYRTGIAVDIPPGHCGLVFMRSSVKSTCLNLANAVGVIDSGYSGEITCVFRQVPIENGSLPFYMPGDRVAQLVIVPLPPVTFVEVEDVDDFDHTTSRGAGGYGSTGN